MSTGKGRSVMIEIKVDKDPHILIPDDLDVRIVCTKSFFEKNGLLKWISDFKPNQIYFLNAALKLEMLAESGDLFKHDQVIGTTYPTSKSIIPSDQSAVVRDR